MNKFKIKRGLDGLYYAVFRNSIEAENMKWLFRSYPVFCFDGYENAYCLGYPSQ